MALNVSSTQINIHLRNISFSIVAVMFLVGCVNTGNVDKNYHVIMPEKQITFSEKNHALDNNDNFSPDDKFLCYDTRGTVYNDNLANCKSIEKVEIETGIETIIWKPESITGEEAAPGVAAVSYHPTENKVIFIHGPFIDEVNERGYYDIRNRTGVEVSVDGNNTLVKVDMRDVATHRPTTSGAHRGGTHRHEYSRNGKRIGFTYDDFLNRDYDRTIGYMEESDLASEGYSHYFSVLLKPTIKGQSKPGEIEKAYGDSWVDSAGTKRAFIGKVRAQNGVDYEASLFVAEIPDNCNITTAFSGNNFEYPLPPERVMIRRLTHDKDADGIVRGSYDGKYIAYLSNDSNNIKQVFVIPADGTDLHDDIKMRPKQVTHFENDASFVRWHPSGEWLYSVCNGNVAVTYVREGDGFGRTFFLTNDNLKRKQIVVSHSGSKIAYGIDMPSEKNNKIFTQIFVMDVNFKKLVDNKY